MNASPKRVDARGLPCPEPVVRVKREFESGAGALEVLVDNEAARDNVLRFASYSRRSAAAESLPEGSEYGAGSILVRIEAASGTGGAAAEGSSGGPAGGLAEASSSTGARLPAAAGVVGGALVERSAEDEAAKLGLTVLLASDRLGEGDPALGALLVKGLLYALSELEEPPARLVLMNGGVRLALEGSESLGHLRKLEEAGTELLACGTCLDFFGAKDRLAAGRVSNMYEIAGILARDRVLRP